MSALPRWLLALGGGAVWGLCFGRQAVSFGPWLALVPLILLLGQRRAVALGWVHGVAFWLISIPWIIPTVRDHGQLSLGMAVLGMLALAAYLGLFSGLFAAGGAVLWKRGGWVAWLGIPATWVVTEWLRAHLFSGFPWSLAAYAWIDVPGALPLSAWIGPYGVGFLLVLANVSVAIAIQTRRWRLATATLGAILVLLAMGARWAGPSLQENDDRETVDIRLLQPNIGILQEWDPVRVEEQYQQIFQMSRRACTQPGVLVIWPESAAWPYSYSRDERFRLDVESLSKEGCPVLVNTSMTGEGGTFNSLLMIEEGAVGGRYDKQHLVPFGEYVPMAGWLPFLDKIARSAGEFLAGQEPVLLGWAGERLAPAICFEITFPEEVAAQVRRGGSILVTVTNDAWYGDSWAPWQHFRAARFRAAENGRYLVRSAITGVSAVVAPNGAVEQQLGVGEQGTLAASVTAISAMTLYTRIPWGVPLLCLVLAAFAIFLGRKGTQS